MLSLIYKLMVAFIWSYVISLLRFPGSICCLSCFLALPSEANNQLMPSCAALLVSASAVFLPKMALKSAMLTPPPLAETFARVIVDFEGWLGGCLEADGQYAEEGRRIRESYRYLLYIKFCARWAGCKQLTRRIRHRVAAITIDRLSPMNHICEKICNLEYLTMPSYIDTSTIVAVVASTALLYVSWSSLPNWV